MADIGSDTLSPLEDLWALRNRLVQYRRDAASDPADATAGIKLKNLQEQIEAVDRAIADEQKPQPSIFDRGLV